VRILKRLAIALGILVVVAFVGCLHRMGSEPVPETTAYRIDLPRILIWDARTFDDMLQVGFVLTRGG